MLTLAGYVVVTVTGSPGVHVLLTVTTNPLELNVAAFSMDVPAPTVDWIVDVRPGSATPAIVAACRAPSLVAAVTS